MEGLLIFGIVAILGLSLYLSWYFKKKRREELARVASQLGLQYSRDDVLGSLSLPFSLLTRGDGRGTENVIWGTWQGIDLREFDYWYYEESTDSEGRTSRTYYRFSCAVTELPVVGAALSLTRENVFSRLADHMGMHDLEFELEAFNKEFTVKCRDAKFATDVVDQRMMEWLLQCGGGWNFELSGSFLMCYSKRRRPTELVPLLGTLKAFRDHIPRVVYGLYGTGSPPPPPAVSGFTG